MTAKNLRQFEFKLGKLGIIIFLAGFTVLAFVSFLVGVQVGRNIDTYPEWFARGIPTRILELIGPPGPSARRDIPVGKPGALFDVPAGDSQTGKPAEGEKGPAAGAAPPTITGPAAPAGEAVTPPAGSAVTVPGVSAATGEAKSAAAQTAAAAGNAKNEKTPATAKAEGKKEKEAPSKSGRYVVQVVSFREKEKAEGLSKKILSLGYTPQVSLTDITGKGKWYRVTVEGFETKQTAEKAVENMTSKIKGLSCVIKGK